MLAATLKDRLKGSKAFRVARGFRQCVKKSLADSNNLDLKVASLKPQGTPCGHVLVSYINNAFFLKPGQPVPNSHIHYWVSLQIAQTFLDLGYVVDVISYRNLTFVPQKRYSIVLDVRRNLQRWASLLPEDCLKIMFLDTANILFHNAAESSRLLALQQRRGVTLMPRRYEKPNLGLEHADCGITSGNEFAINTFKYANKPIYRVPIPSGNLWPWPEEKKFEDVRRNFLWFASGGLVHKGLDLVLEAFAGMPEYHLTVCGPIQAEPDFEEAFCRELYYTPNIKTIGWIDTDSPEFTEIVTSCTGLVHASCSEGAVTSAVVAMHAGLIPILSYESGVDVEDFGFRLKSSSVQDIRAAVREVASLPVEILKERARKSWEYARANHTREKFADEYKKTIIEIIRNHSKRPN